MESGLRGKFAAVTGAASGIGAAAAKALAAEGARVALIDRDHAAAQAQAAALPGALAYACDVADAEAVTRTFAAIAADFGGLDVLVNNAGVESVWTIANMPPAEWDRVLGINLRGAMLCTRATVPLLRARGGGAVVNIASVAGKRMSYSGDAAYTASKAGLLGFTRHAAYELGAYGIRVNAVCPGPTLTPMITRNLDRAAQDAVAKAVPLGRWVLPADVACAIVFLAGDTARACTGTALDVDGGVLVSNGGRHEDYFARRR
jgi:NAD(P)-dependent dehydrogenase (short-subunit alcohol dehydrogenase family)